MAIVATAQLCAFPAFAVTNVHGPYPLVIAPGMTQYNGQLFGNQICPIEDYNTANPAAILANHEKYGLVKRIVLCVQGLVIPATYRMMNDYAISYFYGPVAAAMTLAVALWGIMVATGKQQAVLRDAFVVALKIGSVSMFTYMLGRSTIWPDGLFPVLIGIVDELSAIVSVYIGYSTSLRCAVAIDPTDMWGRVDCALNTLVGAVFNPMQLVAGLVGFFACAFISGTFGIFIALVGFSIMAQLIFAILRATYVVITAYVAIAIMALISPIFITCLLFNVTRAYFEKWVRLLISFMLQPIFLFAYLAMMLAAFDTVIYDGPYSVYRAIASPVDIGFYPAPLRAYPAQNSATNPTGDFLIGQWLWDEGLYRKAEGAAIGVSNNPREVEAVKANNIGLMGGTGTEERTPEEYTRQDPAGILLNVLDNFNPVNIFKVDIPIARISWKYLALLHLCDTPNCNAYTKEDEICRQYCSHPAPSPAMCNPIALQYSGVPPNPTTNPMQCTDDERDAFDAAIYNIRVNYLIQLLLSLLIAFLTMYLFHIMIDMLPFIGSGMGGSPTKGMPSIGDMKMPGNKLMDKMKAGMGKLAGGIGGGQ